MIETWTQTRTVGLLGLLLALAQGGLGLGLCGCSDDDTQDPCEQVKNRCDLLYSKSCEGDTILVCSQAPSGCLEWLPSDTCPPGLACFGGSCVCDDECAPDTTGCEGNTVVQCGVTSDGCLLWEEMLDCAASEMSCDDTEDATCVVGAGCGNDLLEPSELCDGTDLGGEDCLSQGFGGGALLCNSSCDGFDTSACVPSPACGNGTIEPPEVCDGSDLGGADCESEGFHGGDLACRANCGAFDTSGCDGFCGDGTLNGPEQCDTNDLGTETCESLGFLSGTLQCDASCLLDTAQCSSPWQISSCWLQAPAPAATAPESSFLPITGQVRIAGLTDQSNGPDPDPLVWVDVGAGPDGADPLQSPGSWTWYPAFPLATFNHPNDDHYEGDLLVPSAAASPYDYAVRVSLDAGQSWTYCDLNGGTYSPAEAGDLTVIP